MRLGTGGGGHVNERAVTGQGEVRRAARLGHDAFQDGDRLTCHLQPILIEGHCAQRPRRCKYDVPADVTRKGAAANERLPGARLQIENGNVLVLSEQPLPRANDAEEHAAASREHVGPVVADLAVFFVDCREGVDRPTRRPASAQAFAADRREDNGVVGTPARAARGTTRALPERHGLAAIDGHFLPCAIDCREANPASVWRQEWICGE